MLRHFVYVPLSDRSSQILIVTGHDHLHQILVIQLLITIWVKVLDDVISIGFSCFFNTVVAKELEDFQARDPAILIPVDSLKSRMRLKAIQSRQNLSLALYGAFTFRDCDQEALEEFLVGVGQSERFVPMQCFQSIRASTLDAILLIWPRSVTGRHFQN